MADELPQNFSLAELIHANTKESAEVHKAVITDISERKAQRRRDQLKFALLFVLLGILVLFFRDYTRDENNRSDKAAEDRASIHRTLELIENCVSADKVDSDCQQRARENTAKAVVAISDNQRDLLIVALQCFRDPINVDNAAIEDCILSEGELLRKQREQNQ